MDGNWGLGRVELVAGVAVSMYNACRALVNGTKGWSGISREVLSVLIWYRVVSCYFPYSPKVLLVSGRPSM